MRTNPTNVPTTKLLIPKPERKHFTFIIASTMALLTILCAITSGGFQVHYDRPPARVYKSELASDVTDEEIARILVRRMMNRHLIGTRGWMKWIFSYHIEKLELGSAQGVQDVKVVIHVRPLDPLSWNDMWTHEVVWTGIGEVRVGYWMVMEDMGTYYELQGPYTLI